MNSLSMGMAALGALWGRLLLQARHVHVRRLDAVSASSEMPSVLQTSDLKP